MNKWDPADVGTLTWDSSFDPLSTDAQLFIQNVCKKAAATTCGISACSNGMLVRSTTCWVDT